MDIRKPTWHGQLSITGIGTPSNYQGSVVEMLSQVLRDLNSTNPRAMADGQKEIIIRIRNTPYGMIKTTGDLDRVMDVEAGLIAQDGLTPNDGETMEQFFVRLCESGHTEPAADFLARDWFDQPQSLEMLNWLNDPQAQRFRQLNYDNNAFESAAPQEYAILKHYVVSNFPAMVASLTFRVC